MITVRYRNVIINGIDRSGRVETLPDSEALRLVELGFADAVKESAVLRPPETAERPAFIPPQEVPADPVPAGTARDEAAGKAPGGIISREIKGDEEKEGGESSGAKKKKRGK